MLHHFAKQKMDNILETEHWILTEIYRIDIVNAVSYLQNIPEKWARRSATDRIVWIHPITSEAKRLS